MLAVVVKAVNSINNFSAVALREMGAMSTFQCMRMNSGECERPNPHSGAASVTGPGCRDRQRRPPAVLEPNGKALYGASTDNGR